MEKNLFEVYKTELTSDEIIALFSKINVNDSNEYIAICNDNKFGDISCCEDWALESAEIRDLEMQGVENPYKAFWENVNTATDFAKEFGISEEIIGDDDTEFGELLFNGALDEARIDYLDSAISSNVCVINVDCKLIFIPEKIKTNNTAINELINMFFNYKFADYSVMKRIWEKYNY